MVKITVTMHTARRDYAMVGRPDTHIFEPTLDSLSKQTFTDFEFILIDVLYDRRMNYFVDKSYNFPIKHIPPKKNYWLEHGFPAISCCKNTGIIHANGDLIIFLDDCCELELDFLQLFWELFTTHGGKILPRALFKYYEGNVPMLHKVDEYPGEDPTKIGTQIRDSALDLLETIGQDSIIQEGCNFCGYSSASLEALFKVNGFDEMFDGTKGVEDCDMGIRLFRAGYKSIIDKRLTVIEHHHHDIYDANRDDNFFNGKLVKCNSPLLDMMIKRGDDYYRANERVLTFDEKQYIRKWHEDHNQKLEPEFQLYETDPPMFNIRGLWDDNHAKKTE